MNKYDRDLRFNVVVTKKEKMTIMEQERLIKELVDSFEELQQMLDYEHAPRRCGHPSQED